MKLKMTLSNQGKPGTTSTGFYSNVQVDFNLPKGVYMEKKMFKWETLSLSGTSTPPTELLYIYAQNNLIPSDMNIELCMTYMQSRAQV